MEMMNLLPTVLTFLSWAVGVVVVLVAVIVVVGWIYLVFHIGRPRPCKSQANIKGKTVIVTGANSGIGKETALDLARRGARVICACRSEQRGKEAVQDIQEKCGHKNVFFEQLDLADFDSIQDFAERIKKKESQLDILLNNAGFANNLCDRTKQGHELMFGVNHLGPFLLTHLLLDLLKASAPSRIVNVASTLYKSFRVKHGMKKIDGIYRDLDGYAASKMGNILHVKELARHLDGSGVTANALHPGLVASNIWRALDGPGVSWLVKTVMKLITRYLMWDCTDGAQTSIYCAIEESLETVSGKYFHNCATMELTKLAQSDELAKQFWDISMELCDLQ